MNVVRNKLEFLEIKIKDSDIEQFKTQESLDWIKPKTKFVLRHSEEIQLTTSIRRKKL